MKNKILFLTVIFIVVLQFSSCKDSISSGYTLELPEVPESWILLLGNPYWHIEWLDPSGEKKSKDIVPGESRPGNTEIEIPVTWANPVTAWPFWPEFNLIPGFFKPAGALFPFDVYGKSLQLSWKAGLDTVFYWELAFANEDQASKIPANFDWPRFRELFETDALNEAVRRDPWLVDWRSVAQKTILSSFDRRRLVPQAAESVNIPAPSGTWYKTSPFAEPLFFAEDENPVFPVYPCINVWISSEGILRINGKTWVLYEFP
jgi:hypothetical protein